MLLNSNPPGTIMSTEQIRLQDICMEQLQMTICWMKLQRRVHKIYIIVGILQPSFTGQLQGCCEGLRYTLLEYTFYCWTWSLSRSPFCFKAFLVLYSFTHQQWQGQKDCCKHLSHGKLTQSHTLHISNYCDISFGGYLSQC